MWLEQASRTLFLLQDLQLSQLTFPILLTFTTWCDFWSAFPRVFNSCPNTLLKISLVKLICLVKLPWTSAGTMSGQQWVLLKISTRNCSCLFGCSGHWFHSKLTVNPGWQHYSCCRPRSLLRTNVDCFLFSCCSIFNCMSILTMKNRVHTFLY